MNLSPASHLTLGERFAALAAETPGLRKRDAALKLGVSEAELALATICEAQLDGRFRELFVELGAVGPVTALSRNDHAVIEKIGPYENVSGSGPMGLALGAQIDLRFFWSRWALGLACREQTGRGLRRSLQFFDTHGQAIHKLYLERESDEAAYDQRIEQFRAPSDRAPPQFIPRAAPEAPRPDSAIEREALLEAWSKLEDTHDFFGLLRRFAVARTQAFRLAAGHFTEAVPKDSARRVLEAAARDRIPLMVFVGNAGIIQIHTGPVHTVKATGDWFNVLDPDFNLHLYEPGVAAAWVVRKPTRDGTVTSLELYDAAGDMIAYLFGARKPGQPEREDWRQLVRSSLEATGAGRA